MARPAVAVAVNSKNMTKEEKENRKKVEEKVKGKSDKLKPKKYLSKSQKKIFKFIIAELEESDILGNLDLYVLTQAAIAIDRLEELESKANENPDIKFTSSFKNLHDMYSKNFFRCCNELCLSPQARAKLSIGVKDPNKKKTLRDVLGEDE